jgi:hypothetical protein
VLGGVSLFRSCGAWHRGRVRERLLHGPRIAGRCPTGSRGKRPLPGRSGGGGHELLLSRGMARALAGRYSGPPATRVGAEQGGRPPVARGTEVPHAAPGDRPGRARGRWNRPYPPWGRDIDRHTFRGPGDLVCHGRTRCQSIAMCIASAPSSERAYDVQVLNASRAAAAGRLPGRDDPRSPTPPEVLPEALISWPRARRSARESRPQGVRVAMDGQCGSPAADVWISPLAALCWFFDVRGLAASHLFLKHPRARRRSST